MADLSFQRTDALKRAAEFDVRQIEPAGSLSMKKTEVPTFDELMRPTVEALKRLEESASTTVLLFSAENLSAPNLCCVATRLTPNFIVD
jgi:hypothetical protein